MAKLAFGGSPLPLHHKIEEEKNTLMGVLLNLMSFENLVVEPLHKFTKKMFMEIVSTLQYQKPKSKVMTKG